MIGAVDIGGTKIAVAAVTRGGEIRARLVVPTAPEAGPQHAVNEIIRLLKDVSAQSAERLDGIGIGCTGPVDPITGTIGHVPFLPGWDGLPLVDELHRAFGVQVAMENDADAGALAEASQGAGRNASRFLYITIGTGIGGAFIIDGQIYRGAGGFHPEFGHQVVAMDGPECTCGARGCWEALASGPALAQQGHRTTARDVCDAARNAVPDAVAAVDQFGFYLGLGLANLVTLLVPDVVALGGGVMRNADLFRDRIAATVRSTCRLVPTEKISIVPAMLGADTALVGAAQVWIKRFEA